MHAWTAIHPTVRDKDRLDLRRERGSACTWALGIQAILFDQSLKVYLFTHSNQAQATFLSTSGGS
ncbi:MAG: hypothetical protein ABI274_04850 [Ktedonobacterales bacterium]